ncbi:MAG: hypothetical protein ACREA0_19650 [bacterium]
MVAPVIQAIGQVLHAVGIDLVKRLVDRRLCVLEFQWGQGFLEVAALLPFVDWVTESRNEKMGLRALVGSFSYE